MSDTRRWLVDLGATPLVVAIGLWCVLSPVPMGLRAAELTVLSLFGVGWLFGHGLIGRQRMGVPLVLAILCATGTALSISRGSDFVYFQFFRGVVFPLVLIWLLRERMHPQLLVHTRTFVPIVAAGAVASTCLYFIFGSEAYNSTLEIPFDSSEYRRLFVYPTYFFLVMLFDAVRRGQPSQYVYVVLLAATGSKAIFLSLLAIYGYFGIVGLSVRRIVVQVLALAVVAFAAISGGLLLRIDDFLTQGDPWRLYEPLAAIERLSDPLRFLIGNGSGVPYWEGQISVGDIEGDPDLRLMQNSFFDVHNGILTLCLKFGVPAAVLYLVLMWRAIPRIRGRGVLAGVVLLNILLSHGPVQVVEAVGLVLGLRLLAFESAREARSEGAIS